MGGQIENTLIHEDGRQDAFEPKMRKDHYKRPKPRLDGSMVIT
jgi:hypothetical protein